MSRTSPDEDIETLTNILEAENKALSQARVADAIAFLPQKQKIADRLAEHRPPALSESPATKIALEKLSKLAERNALLLRQAIDAQKNIVRLLTSSTSASEQTLYGRSGHYTIGQTPSPAAISACG